VPSQISLGAWFNVKRLNVFKAITHISPLFNYKDSYDIYLASSYTLSDFIPVTEYAPTVTAAQHRSKRVDMLKCLKS
jgi:hypothetical protein